MVPSSFINYFIASTGASAALIGLLFVAVSVAPERIFGQESTTERRVQASSAFTALLDAFFVSVIALMPATNIGYAALVLSVFAIVNTVGMGRQFWDERHEKRSGQRLALLLSSVAIYGSELRVALALVVKPDDSSALYGLAYIIIGTYALGIGRAWELLGARGAGILSLLGLQRGDRDPAVAVPTDAGAAMLASSSKDDAAPEHTDPVRAGYQDL